MLEPPDRLLQRGLWYIRDRGQELGPYTTAQIRRRCRQDMSFRTLSVRRVGPGRWGWADEFAELTEQGSRDDTPPSPEDVRAAAEWRDQDRAELAGRHGMMFFGTFLAVLLMIAGDFTGLRLGAKSEGFLLWSMCMCTAAVGIGGFIAMIWLPLNVRRLLRLPAASCALGLIGAAGMALLFALFVLSVASS